MRLLLTSYASMIWFRFNGYFSATQACYTPASTRVLYGPAAYHASLLMPEMIKFDDPVVLVGGGEIDAAILQRYAHLPIVAADGGANHLRQLSLVPGVVVGDLDSLEDKDYWRSVSRVVEISEQDSTDFEKCLYSIDAPYFIAVGFTGNRLDHTLAALHVMQKMHKAKPVVLVSSDDVVYVCSTALELQLPVGTRVSLYPLSRISFKASAGLHYPLDGLTMQSGEMIGTSNQCSEPVVRIVPQEDGSGCYALIVPFENLAAITEMVECQVPAI